MASLENPSRIMRILDVLIACTQTMAKAITQLGDTNEKKD